MENLTQGLEWIGRKIWILLRAFGFMVPAVLSDAILDLSTSQLAQWGAALVSFVIIVFMYWRAEKNGIKIWDRSFLTWKGLGLVVLTFAVAQLFKHLGYYIMELQGIEETSNELELTKLLENIPFWLAFVRIACQAAISEEIIVRGYLFKKLFEKHKILGIVVSGLIFAFLHGPTDLGSWIIYASPGFLLAYLYYKTDYLIYPIAVHFINNAWSVVAFYYFQ
ncbi:TPA: CPBP family intramembrane metalloprotease [Streptococcus suis]|uniref:Protease n=1 Tax=Streptococcus suis TaxID=1307 RepID=A0A116NEA4_STRSU|nr:type II CAAX endopeptidase family protein [Streptococcus suis]NQG28561.1 CPBP family intramembrane metalloprotease [Streptococcus suis]CYV98136.1 protease [Streptococcus suis]HEM5310075.1 CPBP family intramembrane metalloprotease [Streptococcus suis]HEM5326315.1 CPBP family intramembrane metalloprotease [Streptococcus suis]